MINENTFLIKIPEDIAETIQDNDDWFRQYDIRDYGFNTEEIDKLIASGTSPGIIVVDFAPGQKVYAMHGRGMPTDIYSIQFEIVVLIEIYKKQDADSADIFDAIDKQIKSDVGRMEKLFRTTKYVLQGENWRVEGLSVVSIDWGPPAIAETDSLVAQLRSGLVILAGQVEVE